MKCVKKKVEPGLRARFYLFVCKDGGILVGFLLDSYVVLVSIGNLV